jgi:hypothetical protein
MLFLKKKKKKKYFLEFFIDKNFIFHHNLKRAHNRNCYNIFKQMLDIQTLFFFFLEFGSNMKCHNPIRYIIRWDCGTSN